MNVLGYGYLSHCVPSNLYSHHDDGDGGDGGDNHNEDKNKEHTYLIHLYLYDGGEWVVVWQIDGLVLVGQ